ncbi:hypothetical protein PC116_g11191 [Phytophthora cactorum]|uniref:Uncharacterized protein n=1 Tax=Phytophthora cactorum TaxID=29920 RepID=A0A8T1KZF2_9STRA|nr:hypothetical protein PC114_g21148 [Phytophthora cactorum]KAG2904664.1 hypothetical protein PC117_g20973 [Phytophthora cactorum]KAG2983047.1 hypothetical protein PC119_g20672 [Phytophthora cactorum]KAG3176272.1 hypothetical protein C6341_g9045 [Phytophthora cactorum]KAG4240896.1 hypothetical protein PC116_g11191 [Phytophthora cactorum]
MVDLSKPEDPVVLHCNLRLQRLHIGQMRLDKWRWSFADCEVLAASFVLKTSRSRKICFWSINFSAWADSTNLWNFAAVSVLESIVACATMAFLRCAASASWLASAPPSTPRSQPSPDGRTAPRSHDDWFPWTTGFRWFLIDLRSMYADSSRARSFLTLDEVSKACEVPAVIADPTSLMAYAWLNRSQKTWSFERGH